MSAISLRVCSHRHPKFMTYIDTRTDTHTHTATSRAAPRFHDIVFPLMNPCSLGKTDERNTFTDALEQPTCTFSPWPRGGILTPDESQVAGRDRADVCVARFVETLLRLVSRGKQRCFLGPPILTHIV